MTEQLPDTEASLKGGAIAAAPVIVRRHGLQDAHTQPLVAELEDGELRSWRTSPAKASGVDAAIGRLHDAGGHLVATIYRNEPKRIRRPIWERWQERRMEMRELTRRIPEVARRAVEWAQARGWRGPEIDHGPSR